MFQEVFFFPLWKEGCRLFILKRYLQAQRFSSAGRMPFQLFLYHWINFLKINNLYNQSLCKIEKLVGISNFKAVNAIKCHKKGLKQCTLWRFFFSTNFFFYYLLYVRTNSNLLHTGCPVNWYSLSISIPDFFDCPIKKI